VTGDRHDARRDASDELARLLHEPQGLRLFRLRQQVLFREADARPDSAAPEMAAPETAPIATAPAAEDSDAPVPIGIWNPQEVDGETMFVRKVDPGPTGDFWPPHATLAPKQGLLPLRVCLLGESTAAGMFYRPHLTPAHVLQAHLDAIAGPDLFEVVDLTKLSIDLDELIDLARASIQLRPDLLRFFAGNNWAARVMPAGRLGAMQDAAAVLAAEGLPGFARASGEALCAQAAAAPCAGRTYAVLVPTSSTSKTRVAPGGITPPAPRSP